MMTDLDPQFFIETYRTSLPMLDNVDPSLQGAIRHVLDNPGSLVRPRLVHRVATEYGMGSAEALKLAIALEYFHTASILFDDLPCMDNGLERRGTTCTHIVFGESGAILAALALINRAYWLAWTAMAAVPAERQIPAMNYLEHYLGVQGLLNGQSLDLNYSSLLHARETTERIAQGKTVSLIRLSLVLPAMLGDATAREVQLLERIALFWGLGYQIVDDLKDLTQSNTETGKSVARDVMLNRPNLAAAIGIEGASDRLARFIRLGDMALLLLLKSRLGMNFLRDLRRDLDVELKKVSRIAKQRSEGSR